MPDNKRLEQLIAQAQAAVDQKMVFEVDKPNGITRHDFNQILRREDWLKYMKCWPIDGIRAKTFKGAIALLFLKKTNLVGMARQQWVKDFGAKAKSKILGEYQKDPAAEIKSCTIDVLDKERRLLKNNFAKFSIDPGIWGDKGILVDDTVDFELTMSAACTAQP